LTFYITNNILFLFYHIKDILVNTTITTYGIEDKTIDNEQVIFNYPTPLTELTESTQKGIIEFIS